MTRKIHRDSWILNHRIYVLLIEKYYIQLIDSWEIINWREKFSLLLSPAILHVQFLNSRMKKNPKKSIILTSRCLSMSNNAWSIHSWVSREQDELYLITNAKLVTDKTKATVLASNSLASKGAYILRTTSSARGVILLAN